MPREREHTSKRIKTVDYDIDGNQIRAWYDGAGELIFVLDETINRNKPNVLLVIDSFDERKWDDVLVNDYDIDLETVRPKKDNKYQKLDIEYGGLDVYSELIDAYESDDDLSEPLENLKRFQIMSVRRSAKERLAAAEETIRKTQETIERTNDAISDLRARLKELKSKLAEQKRNIGREPTKTSAAKILKTEAQIDATNEKLARAKKRLASAQRRLVAAEDDAEIARAILARHVDVKPSRRVAKPVRVAKRAPVAKEVVREEYESDEDATDEDDYDEEYSESESYNAEPDSADADEEVKPLFDTDPEILDDNIAFKPIDFNAVEESSAPVAEPVTKPVEPVVAPVPLSFAPPSDSTSSTYESNDDVAEFRTENATPMLDSLTTVTESQPEEHIEVETTVETEPGDTVVTEVDTPAETLETIETTQTVPVTEITEIEPVAPIEPIASARTVSPIANTVIQTDVRYTKKPTLVYYVMLILLIGLSIFTLWLYQKRNGTVMPDLAMPTAASESVEQKDIASATETNIPAPTMNTVVEKVDVVSVAEPEPEPEPIIETPVPVAEPEPVAVVAVSEPEPVAVDVAESEPVNVVAESPFVNLRTVATYEPEKKPIPSEEEVLARKPGYNVSQNERMFVAAPDYDSDVVSESVTDDTVVNIESTYSMDTDVQPTLAEGYVPQIVASEVTTVSSTETDEGNGCATGSPDEYGCCPGEEYMYTEDGFMCCAGDDCFPPLQ